MDMLELFAAHDFCWVMNKLSAFTILPKTVLSVEARAELFDAIDIAAKMCSQFGLRSASNQIERIKQNADFLGRINILKLKLLIDELMRRLQEDLASVVFVFIQADKTKYLDESACAEGLEGSFPLASEELRAAGRCYAFSDEIAAVFHSMRALEIGLTALAEFVPYTILKPDWQNVIEGIEGEIKKIKSTNAGPNWKAKEKFCAAAATNFRYFKNAWRNHVMHVRDKYTEREARKIIEHVADFLGTLSAGGLRE